MQRASGLGRAWIIAAALANPIVENSGFLALLIPYVDNDRGGGMGRAAVDAGGGGAFGEISGVLAAFSRYDAGVAGLRCLHRWRSPRPTSKE
jgi:hypothetical protein